jgi:hypothetical protein
MSAGAKNAKKWMSGEAGKLFIKQQVWLFSTHIKVICMGADLQSWRQRLTLKLLKYPLGFSSRTSVWSDEVFKMVRHCLAIFLFGLLWPALEL